MHQARYMSYIDSVYHWLNFQSWSHILLFSCTTMVAYYLTFYYIHIPHHFQVPRFMLVTGTTFHVSYRHTIGPSAWVVDYIITQNIAALTIEGIHIHPQVT